MVRFQGWLARWRLRRIIYALHIATQGALKPQVKEFAEAMMATSLMARGLKKDSEVIVSCSRDELDIFISYMMHLHQSRLSLLLRARIGLATLAYSDKTMLGDKTPEEFIAEEKPKAKSSKDDRRIQLVK